MLIKSSHISDHTMIRLQHVNHHHHRSQTLSRDNHFSKAAISNSRRKQGVQADLMNNSSRLQKYNTARRDFAVHSGVEPGIPPSGPPNILSWIVAIAIGVVVPLISYKWGPSLKNKVETALKITENVAEVVEKVAEDVEKVAEDIADDLPEGGKLRKAVDLVENLAERAAKDAGAVDDFIDKVQEEEEKAEAFVESLKKESKKPPMETNPDEKSDHQNLKP